MPYSSLTSHLTMSLTNGLKRHNMALIKLATNVSMLSILSK